MNHVITNDRNKYFGYSKVAEYTMQSQLLVSVSGLGVIAWCRKRAFVTTA